ncbi:MULTISPECIES: EAL domain-containing protein [unclassified Cupriavidus]|uniref:EAL domain-containing protein n=1 Tax=unclassified Cupriavidus TaxID=2640874 RepID=UPI0013664DC9|nr:MULTISPECIES: EAL domain-containing protein [unclassified Cupriavidus]
MSRLRLWFFMFCVVALGICGPVALTTWLSHAFAEQMFRQRVDQFTERALQRVEAVARDAIAAAQSADAFTGHTCSAAHLDAMRASDLQHRYVRQITYLDDGRFLCASSSLPGALRGIEDQSRPWTPLPELGTSYRPAGAALTQPTIQFRVGRHVAVVDAQFFIDIVPLDAHIRLGMIDTGTGNVVAAWSDTEQATLQRAWSRQLDGQVQEGRYLDVKASRSLPFAVVAYEPSVELNETWARLLYASVPLALGVSALATWLMLRWGRRLSSPEHALRGGIRRKEFFAVYQPVMALQSGHCIGAEALVRWRLPDGQIAMPDNFIPMAEATGTVHAITRCMVEAVLADLGAQLAADRSLHISINLSPEDFRRADTLPFLTAALQRKGIRAQQLWIEVTERGFANDAACREAIAAFRRAGHPTWIDDFGTGYSSLAYLQDLDVDGLKIDRAFVESMTTDGPTRGVGPHIIEMARALDIRMVAEGIETETQCAVLQQRGVQYGQGWLFGRPMPVADFIDFFRRRGRQEAGREVTAD